MSKSKKYKLGIDKSVYIECFKCEKRSYSIYDIKNCYCPVCWFFVPNEINEPIDLNNAKDSKPNLMKVALGRLREGPVHFKNHDVIIFKNEESAKALTYFADLDISFRITELENDFLGYDCYSYKDEFKKFTDRLEKNDIKFIRGT